jgi:hypothetical protein
MALRHIQALLESLTIRTATGTHRTDYCKLCQKPAHGIPLQHWRNMCPCGNAREFLHLHQPRLEEERDEERAMPVSDPPVLI